MEKTASRYLEYLRVPISKKYCERLILSHPDFPSLISISDTFERFGIEHYVSKVKEEDLRQLSFPYLLHLGKGRSKIILIRDKEDLRQRHEDLKDWSGVVLQAWPISSTTNRQNNLYHTEEKYLRRSVVICLLSVALLLTLPFMFFPSRGNILDLFLLLTAFPGCVVGYLLVAKDLGIKYQAVEAFCNASRHTNCDKVLNSESARILGPVKFSDAVITYFVFQLIVVSLSVVLPDSRGSCLLILSAAGMVSILVVLFSLYYQYFRAKTWCRLCLAVDAILILQAWAWSYTMDWSSIDFGNNFLFSGAALLLVFVALGSLVVFLKRQSDDNRKAYYREIRLSRVKHSTDVFTHLLFQQKKVDVTAFKQEIVIGDPDAPVKLIAAINLNCSPCKLNHEKTESLLAMYPGKVNISIRILPGRNDLGNGPSSIEYILQYWLENIYGKPNESEESAKLMTGWYNLMNIERFREEYSAEMRSDVNNQVKQLEAQHLAWIKEVGITETPTLFFNGYKLPSNYDVEDLMVMIPNLADYFRKRNKVEELLESVK